MQSGCFEQVQNIRDGLKNRHEYLEGRQKVVRSFGMQFNFFAAHFQHVDDLFDPKIDQIYNFIQILLGPVFADDDPIPS